MHRAVCSLEPQCSRRRSVTYSNGHSYSITYPNAHGYAITYPNAHGYAIS